MTLYHVAVETISQVVALLLIPPQSSDLLLVILHFRLCFRVRSRRKTSYLTLWFFSRRKRPQPSLLVQFLQLGQGSPTLPRMSVVCTMKDVRLPGGRWLTLLVFLWNLRVVLAEPRLIEVIVMIHFVDFWVESAFPIIERWSWEGGGPSLFFISDESGTSDGFARGVVAHSGLSHSSFGVIVVVVIMDVVLRSWNFFRIIVILFAHLFLDYKIIVRTLSEPINGKSAGA